MQRGPTRLRLALFCEREGVCSVSRSVTPTLSHSGIASRYGACKSPTTTPPKCGALSTSDRLALKQLSVLSGIPIHVFTYWIRQDKEAALTAEESAPAFLELVPAGSPQAAPSTSGIELLLPCGTRAILAPDFDEASLARLLAAARC